MQRRDSLKRKVILDCDPGIDDSLAIMLALCSPEIEVIAITIVAGNAPVKMGYQNAKKVLRHMNRLDIPVYIGEEKPLVKDFVNALDTHGSDGLGESFLPEVMDQPPLKNAIDFFRETLSEKGVSVIALGPLTNLARLIEVDAGAFANIEQLVSMGGSYKAHGNCSPVAEYNYWEDPEAAQIVFQHMKRLHKQIHMVGLDVTRKIVLTPTLLEYIKRLDAKQGEFISKITKFYFDFHWNWEQIIGCVINDPLAVAYFLKPDLCQGFEAYTDIETQGIARGQSIVDAYDFYKEEKNAWILTSVEAKEFFYFFLARILHLKREELSYLEAIFLEETA